MIREAKCNHLRDSNNEGGLREDLRLESNAQREMERVGETGKEIFESSA